MREKKGPLMMSTCLPHECLHLCLPRHRWRRHRWRACLPDDFLNFYPAPKRTLWAAIFASSPRPTLLGVVLVRNPKWAQTAIFLLFSPFSALNPSSDNSLFDKLCQVLYNYNKGDDSTLRGRITAEDGKFKWRLR